MSQQPLRLVVHAIIRIEIFPALIKRLKDQIANLCAKQGMVMTDFFIDVGVPKRRPEDYPALDVLRRGQADILLVSRTPLFTKSQRRDLLERLCLPEDSPIAFLPVARLRELGLLPEEPASVEAAPR